MESLGININYLLLQIVCLATPAAIALGALVLFLRYRKR